MRFDHVGSEACIKTLDRDAKRWFPLNAEVISKQASYFASIGPCRSRSSKRTNLPQLWGQMTNYRCRDNSANEDHYWKFEMVPRDGVEPPTLRFSVACSTN